LRWHTTSAQRGLPSQIAEAFKDYDLASKIGEIMQQQVLHDIAPYCLVTIFIVEEPKLVIVMVILSPIS
ncbi:hypothetical protein IAF33_19420, partial [Acinetobacter baumannii]|nr:hypothetical protein [Acinetobacter baumannii]